jgi:hypothetical protein
MRSDLPSICEERARLLHRYKEAVGDYANTVRDMVNFVLSSEEARASETRRLCRTSWEEAESSRLALYRHEADHNCASTNNGRIISET